MRWLPSIVRDQNVNVIENSKSEVLPYRPDLKWINDRPTRLSTKVVIISYDLITRMEKQLTEAGFRFIICDESHYLKNAKVIPSFAFTELEYALLLHKN